MPQNPADSAVQMPDLLEFEKIWRGKRITIPVNEPVYFTRVNECRKAVVILEQGSLSEIYGNNDYTKLFDYDKITQDLCCRTRKAGDQITLPGGTKKLKSFFIDEKIPADVRGSIPLIACGRDIVWIYGGRTSAKFAPDAQTTQYVRIRITEARQNERKN